MSVKALLGCAAAMLLLPAMAVAETPKQAQQPLEFTVTVHGDSHATLAGSPSEHLMSFAAPIEIPGVGLPAGSYLFRFITPSVVQVTSRDRSMVYGMFLTTPASRHDDRGDQEMTFERQGNGTPARIEGWFFQDSLNGVAPVYPEA
jgi:hypothetical protein